MPEENNQPQSFVLKIVKRFQKTLSSFINAIAETITNSVHIPQIAIGPIVGSLITATTTLIIGFLTISNIFSEQFLYRPLQIQDNNANYTLELERYHQTILTDYLNQTTQLTLDYPLWKLQQNPYLLRANTQTALSEIDGERKRYIIMFLEDTHLLTFKGNKIATPLLKNANLTEAKLDNLDLSYANFMGADLTKANLSQANLHGSNFYQAKLNNANMTNADLRSVNLEKTDLTNTNLTNACYDNFTKLDPQFDPNKAKMRLISAFNNCDIVPIEKDVKKIDFKPNLTHSNSN
ncbi:pentapeptide repeat-containing protein [Geminocystis sp. GBBB08]|uniref:pentapeptide repeat-containing protein n=1 Tax=Geminocystis sp. GBBB08 TaxID=2604140 RepID=UPI0027E38429|nr:pentapeptide repeat-containing protein [Geminocystis sp. GBBB08]MBL1210114.1 pentapeptide repeat-containing protein [Geminocystis sp. GBBB08]